MLGPRGHLCRPAGRRPDMHCTLAPLRDMFALLRVIESGPVPAPTTHRALCLHAVYLCLKLTVLTHCLCCFHGSLNCFSCYTVGSYAPLFGSSVWRMFGACRRCAEPCFRYFSAVSFLGCRQGKLQATLVRVLKRGSHCRRTQRKDVWKGHCIPSAQDISEIQTVTGFVE